MSFSNNLKVLNYILNHQNDINVKDLVNFEKKLKTISLESIGNSIKYIKNLNIAGMYIMKEIDDNCRENYIDHINDFHYMYNENQINFVEKFNLQINIKLKDFEYTNYTYDYLQSSVWKYQYLIKNTPDSIPSETISMCYMRCAISFYFNYGLDKVFKCFLVIS